MYISITGLKPKNVFRRIQFWGLAIPSFRQAQTAEGNIFCQVKKIEGFQCTLTAWETREHMLQFMRGGVHLKAMKSFPKIATGLTYGYEGEEIPDWKQAFQFLKNHGANYQR